MITDILIGRAALGATAAAFVLGACGSDDSASGAAGDGPTVVVTTSVLGDVVSELVGDQADVVTVMGPGADPHVFQASAREVNQMRKGDALIVNGGGHESGLLDVIEATASDGVPTYEMISGVSELIEGGEHSPYDDEHGDDERGDEGHEDDEHDDEEHDHGDLDPHFYLDPARLVESLAGLSGFLAANVEGLDTAALDEATAAYIAEVEELDAESEAAFSALAADRRKLVSNHDALAYLADRYDLEVVGTVIPSGLSTGDAASAGELAELAGVIEDARVPAIFSDTSASDDVAQALADEVGHDVEIVALHTGSLGEDGSGAETYVTMMEQNVTRITEALS